jgi:DNA-3-methyladenine glycosylase
LVILLYSMKKLKKEFYLRDVNVVAKELLGKRLVTNFNGQLTAGLITETEAYAGVTDRASHAYGGRRTARTEIMYSEGGVAYVYLCYGMYSLFNVVTGKKDLPHAVLIRAIQPVTGLETMMKRRKMKSEAKNFSSGPGTLAMALGIHFRKHSGLSLLDSEIWIEEGQPVNRSAILTGPRIGVDYAGKDAFLPYRHRIVLSTGKFQK